MAEWFIIILGYMIKLKRHLNQQGDKIPNIELQFDATLKMVVPLPSTSIEIEDENALKFMNYITGGKVNIGYPIGTVLMNMSYI